MRVLRRAADIPVIVQHDVTTTLDGSSRAPIY